MLKIKNKFIKSLALIIAVVLLMVPFSLDIQAVDANVPGSVGLAIINGERAKEGLGPLQNTYAMFRISADWSRYMHGTDQFVHMYHIGGYEYQAAFARENGFNIGGDLLGLGYRSEAEVAQAWLDSPPHRAWLMDAYGPMSVASIAGSGYYWTLYVAGYPLSHPAPNYSPVPPGSEVGPPTAVLPEPKEILPPVIDDSLVERLAGGNRYSTAVEISKKAYTSANTVVLVSGESFPDALAGTPLARVNNAPILLTARDEVPKVVLDEIQRLGASKVILLGGDLVISDKVERQLSGYNLERISGGNRNVTGVNIGDKVIARTNSKSAVLVNGYNFPDGLSVGSPAALAGSPIVFTQVDDFPGETLAALDRWGIEEITLVGGYMVISQEVEDELRDLGFGVTRIAGGSRYSTALEIAQASFDRPDTVIIASGQNFPDALAGGSLAASLEAPILLVEKDNIRTQVLNYLRDQGVENVIVLGGPLVISDKLIRDIDNVIR